MSVNVLPFSPVRRPGSNNLRHDRKSLDPDDHRVRATERFDPCLIETGLAPSGARSCFLERDWFRGLERGSRRLPGSVLPCSGNGNVRCRCPYSLLQLLAVFENLPSRYRQLAGRQFPPVRVCGLGFAPGVCELERPNYVSQGQSAASGIFCQPVDLKCLS